MAKKGRAAPLISSGRLHNSDLPLLTLRERRVKPNFSLIGGRVDKILTLGQV